MFGLTNRSQKTKFLFWVGFLILFVLFLFPSKTLADYNKDLILTDAEFTYYNSMTAAEINNFLISKGSVFANYVIPEYVEVPFPYQGGNWASVSVRQVNDVTGEILYGKTVAQLIYDEAQQHQINPRVIIAIMQKESSTITQSSVSQTRLAWPLFYGFDETMAAFGYSYDVARAKALDFGGVARQIAYATANFRAKYDLWSTLNWQAPMTIDGVTVYPQSICTRLFYIYTPHMWTNFYNIYYSWFPYLVDASLVRKENDPTVYLVNQNIKYPIPNPDIFLNWGFRWEDIKIDNTIDAIPTGSEIKRLARGSGPTVYLMDRGFKNPIPNPDIFLNWGFRWEDIVVLSDAFINSKPTGKTLKRIAKSVSSPTVYLMDQNLKKPIPDIATFYRWNFYWEDLVIVSDEFLYYYKTGKPLKTLAKASSPAVYFIERGAKRLIPDPRTFIRLGFKWEDILPCSDEFLYYYPLGPVKRK